MSTSPEPATGDNGDGTAHSTSEDTAKGKAKDTGDLKFMVTAVYPFLGGTALWILGLFVLLSGEASYAVLFVGAAIALIGGVHRWLRWVLEGRDEPRPWQFPTVLSTAMTASVCVAALPLPLNIDPTLSLLLPLLAPMLCILGVSVLALAEWRHRFAGALASVVAVALALPGIALAIAVQQPTQEEEREQKREALRQQIQDFPHAIAVLDSPDWRATGISINPSPQRATVTYELADPGTALEVRELSLRTESIDTVQSNEGTTELYEPCESEGGDKRCEEHGDVVLAEISGEPEGILTVGTEFSEGVIAHVLAPRTDEGTGIHEPDPPEVDMVELAERIRPAEPAETEELIPRQP